MIRRGKVVLIAGLCVLLVAVLASAAVVLFSLARMQRGTAQTVERPETMELLEEAQDASLQPIESAAQAGPAGEAGADGETEDGETAPEAADGAEPEALGEDEAAPYEEQPIYKVDSKHPDVVNILLIGTDSRSGDITAKGRSDSMMLVSYDKKNGTVKLVSLLRDSWVKVNGTRWGRLNTAYNSGGAGSLINTLNLSFDLDIQYYAAVSFTAFEELIDRIGGVTVELTAKEAGFINTKMKRKVLEVRDGPVLLDGEKALWYARCRADSDGDFSRTARQRYLLQLIFESMKTEANLGSLAALAAYAVENVTTNLTFDMLVSLGTSVLTEDIALESHRLPFDGMFRHANKNGAAVLSLDLEDNTEALHAVLYGE